jgi:hypothetical protein
LHGGAYVEHEHGARVRLFLELLDHPAIGTTGDPPVEIAQVVARHVRPVLGELDTEALPRRPMHTGHEAVDHPAGDELQVAKGCQDGGVELIGAWLGHVREG